MRGSNDKTWRHISTVYEEQLETKFWRETENVFILSLSHSCYYDVDGICATPSFLSVKEADVACSTVEWPLILSSSFLSISPWLALLILQPFRRITYVTAHSPTLPLLHLRHSSFSNPSFASLTSQALHLRHLARRPCISPTLITKFSENIVADTDKNKAVIDCHKCSSSFLSIAKSHPLKIPASVLE